MEVERGMLCRGAVGAAGRPCQEVIQARIDRRIHNAAGRNQREFNAKAPRPKGATRPAATKAA